MRFTFALPVLMIVSAAGASLSAQEKMPPKVTYDDHVKPVFRQKCFSCHNPDKKSGDLDLTSYTNLMQGGGSGTVIEPGDSNGSYLYQLITHDSEPYMPPESPKIPDEMVEVVRKWIDGGVLENAGSKAIVRDKPKFDLALSTAPTERPAVVPMPAHLSKESVTVTPTTTAITAMATSPWAPLAAVAGQDQVLLYHTQTLEILATLPFPEGMPYVLKFSRNGSLLLAGGGRGGASGKVIVWNVRTGERVFEVGDELDAVLAADISADQTLIALGGPQRVVRIYSTEDGRLLHELRKHTDWIQSVEFSPDGVLLATGDRNGGLLVWEGWTGREFLVLNGHTKAVTGVSWRADSNLLASCSEDASVRVWEMENGTAVKNWAAHAGGASSVEFARDGRILSCGRDRVAKLWQQDGTQIRAFEAFKDVALQVTFCDETNRAIAADWTGAIAVWDAVDGKKLGELTANPLKLADRLANAQAILVAEQAKQKPAVAAYTAAQAAAAKIKADLAEAQAAMVTAQKQIETATTAVTASKQTVAQQTAAQQAAQQAVAALEPVVTPLTESAAKAQAAASKAPADKELAELTTRLVAVAAARNTKLAESQKALTVATAALQTATANVVEAEKQLAAANAALQAATQKVQQLTPGVKPAEDAAVAAKTVADTATAAVAAAETQVKHWQAEIALTAKLVALDKQRQAALDQANALAAKQADLATAAAAAKAAADKVQAEITAAQTAASAAKQQAEGATAAAAAAKQAHAAAVAAHQAAAKTAETLQGVMVPLSESLAKAQEAVTKSGGDPKLVAATATLKTAVDGKQAELTTATQSVATRLTAVQTAASQIAATEKAATAATAALAAAQKVVTEITATAPPITAKAAAAQQAADAAGQKVEALTKEIDRIRTEILTVKGVS